MADVALPGEQPYAVTVRDDDLVEVESAAGYTRLRLGLRSPREGELGTWTLEVPARHACVEALLADGAGIVVRPQGTDSVVCSGDVDALYLSEQAVVSEQDGTTRTVATVTATGVVDDVVLYAEQAYPDPTTDAATGVLTTFGVSHDIRTGVAETVLKGYVGDNIGPAAGIARRQYSWLDVPISAGLGASGTWQARFTQLSELVRDICITGGITYRLVQGGPGQVTVQVREPQFIPDARFAVTAGTLSSAVLTLRRPSIDEVIVAGQNEGTAREFVRRTDSALQARFRRRNVRLRDARHVDDASGAQRLAELQQLGDEELAEGAPTAGAQLFAVELPGLRYGVHYELDDEVSAVVAGVEVLDRVRAVDIEHQPGTRLRVTPQVGIPDDTGADVDTVRRLARNLASVVRS